MTETFRVLYAEDNALDADLTRAHFQQNAPDFEIEVVDRGDRCLARLAEGSSDVLLLDQHLPDMDGTTVLKELAARDLLPPVVMGTGAGDEPLVVKVLCLGACDYVAKDGNYLESLPAVLKEAVTEFRRRQEEGHAATGRPRHV